VLEVANNEGWVDISDTAGTSEFAVEPIRRWWHQMGRERFDGAQRLLVTADARGSNDYRVRAWKVELERLAAETGLTVTVCRYPRGTSTRNRIEYRMFSFITMNRRAKPLTSARTIIKLISATSTSTGLTLQDGYDPPGIRRASRSVIASSAPCHRYSIHCVVRPSLLTVWPGTRDTRPNAERPTSTRQVAT